MIKACARVVAFLIDYLLIFLPASMVISVFLGNHAMTNFLPQLLFAVYNVVAITSFAGKTIGKYFSGLRVTTQQEGALFLGIREVFKLLYFIPILGTVLLFLSLVLLACGKKALQDYIGMSDVVSNADYSKLCEGEDRYESRIIR